METDKINQNHKNVIKIVEIWLLSQYLFAVAVILNIFVRYKHEISLIKMLNQTKSLMVFVITVSSL